MDTGILGHRQLDTQRCYPGSDLLSQPPWWYSNERGRELGGCLLWWLTLWVSSVISGLANGLSYMKEAAAHHLPSWKRHTLTHTQILSSDKTNKKERNSTFGKIFLDSATGIMTLRMTVTVCQLVGRSITLVQKLNEIFELLQGVPNRLDSNNFKDLVPTSGQFSANTSCFGSNCL